ncbi:MAG: hypothetical protein K9L60_05855 [Methylovulum sp.]|jgi:hypothetical protein|nr:hypothetical protein [Methylovulum sp.]MCF7998739.1 hypothetical protein [Methylovulum sp.]
MNKKLILAIALLVSNNAFAGADHYLLRDGNHVQHLKIAKLGDDLLITADVDFEPNANEQNAHPCSADINGVGKLLAENELVLKKHSESEASYCELKIHLSPNGAKVEQSKDCDNFAPGICRFATDSKEMVLVK